MNENADPAAAGQAIIDETNGVVPADSAKIGGAFLIVCDWVSQLAMTLAGTATGRHLGSATLPVGVVTAVIGVPIFLFLLRTRRRAT